MADPKKIRVGVNGYGVIGKRVAAAVARQEDGRPAKAVGAKQLPAWVVGEKNRCVRITAPGACAAPFRGWF